MEETRSRSYRPLETPGKNVAPMKVMFYMYAVRTLDRICAMTALPFIALFAAMRRLVEPAYRHLILHLLGGIKQQKQL